MNIQSALHPQQLHESEQDIQVDYSGLAAEWREEAAQEERDDREKKMEADIGMIEEQLVQMVSI